jgi:hypothetical protein
MTKDEAIKMAEEYHRIAMQLTRDFACTTCMGSQEDDNTGRDGVPLPCGECWGRGWTIE